MNTKSDAFRSQMNSLWFQNLHFLETEKLGKGE